MKYIRVYAALFLLLILSSYLLWSAYREVEREAIVQLRVQQRIQAKEAAQGLEGFFAYYTQLLSSLAQIDSIITLDDSGKELLKVFHLNHARDIMSIGRVSLDKMIIHVAPQSPRIGMYVFDREHVQQIWKTHQPVVSDVFLTTTGVYVVSLQVPLFKNDNFDGTLSILIPFERLGRKYLDEIGGSGESYAWLLSRKGEELYCPIPNYMGKTVFESAPDSPSLLAMANEMIQGKAGDATYVFNEAGNDRQRSSKKHAVYLPVHLADNFWSIAVATPESAILRVQEGFRNTWVLIVVIMLFSSALFSYYLGRAFIVEKEGTKRKNAEEALRESEQRLYSVLQGSPIPTYVINERHEVLFWNKAMEELSGIAPDGIIGTTGHWRAMYAETGPCLVDLLLDGKPEQILSSYPEAKKSLFLQEAFEATDFFPKLGKDGKWLRRTAALIRNSQGTLVGAIETIQDVTEPRRAREALVSANQQLNDIIDFLPDATFVIDREGKVIAWNRAIEDMTGVSKKEMIGKGDREYTVPFWGQRRPNLLDLIDTEDGELKSAYTYVTRKRNVLYAETYVPAIYGGNGANIFVAGAPLFDGRGNRVGSIESIRDITETKRKEEALVQAERKFRGIFENSILGIFQVSPRGRLLSANSACARILGYSSPTDLMENRNVLNTFFVDPNSYSELLNCLQVSQTVHEFEAQLHRKDRSIAWVSINALIIKNKYGKIVRIEGSAEDITTRKSVESKLLQAQKLEAIGTLAAGIAHDFNNILAPIIGFAELSLLTVQEDSRLHRNLEKILLSGQRAQDMVRQILTFSRATKQELRPVQVSTLINEVLKLLGSTLPSTIEIRQRIEPAVSSAAIMADPTQIHQVLMNLCTNAWYAMSQRGGVLDVGLSGVKIAPDQCALNQDISPGSYIQLTVSDTGCGMDKNVRERIFDPYFTTKGSQGTGLGLATVYGIVKSLRGGISVESVLNQGTVFKILLPICSGKQIQPSEFPQSMAKGTGRILVVDDEKLIIEMLQSMLENLGYTVSTSTSSLAALETFTADPGGFDLVITDQTMPGMTGTQLTEQIRRISGQIPIILCSGFSEMAEVKGAKGFGIDEVFAKPISYMDLAQSIAKLIANRPNTGLPGGLS